MDDPKWPRLFLICMLLMVVPIKNVHYLIPAVYLGLRLLTDGAGYGIRCFAFAGPVVMASATSLLIDHFLGCAVNPAAMFIAVFTYSTLFVAAAERYQEQISAAVMSQISRYVAWFVIVESFLGYVQFLGSVATVLRWDVVSGTFGMLDFYYGRASLGQIYFTFNLFCMILFLLLNYRTLLTKVAVGMGLVAIALAQSGHQTIFFFVSVGLMTAVHPRRVRITAALGVLIVGLFAAVCWLSPDTLRLTGEWFRRVALDPKSPKWMAVNTGAEILADPKNLTLGTGLGQYASRAANISTNEYLQVRLPAVLVGKSDYFRQGIAPAQAEFAVTGEGSAIPQPCFSVLSVPVECGLVLTGIMAVAAMCFMREHFRLMGSGLPDVAAIGLLSNVGMLFFILCCTVETYAEFPQAILLPLLLYVVSRSRAATLLNDLVR